MKANITYILLLLALSVSAMYPERDFYIIEGDTFSVPKSSFSEVSEILKRKGLCSNNQLDWTMVFMIENDSLFLVDIVNLIAFDCSNIQIEYKGFDLSFFFPNTNNRVFADWISGGQNIQYGKWSSEAFPVQGHSVSYNKSDTSYYYRDFASDAFVFKIKDGLITEFENLTTEDQNSTGYSRFDKSTYDGLFNSLSKTFDWNSIDKEKIQRERIEVFVVLVIDSDGIIKVRPFEKHLLTEFESQVLSQVSRSFTELRFKKNQLDVFGNVLLMIVGLDLENEITYNPFKENSP